MYTFERINNNGIIFNGNCFDVLPELVKHNIKVDLIVTDPPYLISVTNGGGTLNNKKKFRDSMNSLVELNIDKGFDVKKFCGYCIELMTKFNGYFWCNKLQIPDYFNFFINEHKYKFDILRWFKTNAVPSYSNKYLSDTEYCLYFRNGGKCNPVNYEDGKTEMIAPINQKDKKLWKHPTIKPLWMIEKLIRNSTNEGDIVIDPFMGSGTTCVACLNLNRKFIGIELDKAYYEIAKNRILQNNSSIFEIKT